MNIENINMWLTIVSIIASLVTIWQACIAKKYKNQIHNVLNAVNIIEISKKFESSATSFILNTRADDWFRGKKSEKIINPMITILVKLSSLPELSDNLKNKIKALNNNLLEYEKADSDKKRNTNMLILDIQGILQNEVESQLNKL